MASPRLERALQTPRPNGQSGILRSPSTPGTGSSVRFGMRVYETGEESVLSTSHGSSAPTEAVPEPDASANMQLSDTSEIQNQNLSMNGSVSMEMSFTESFLKREVGDAIAGLTQSTSKSAAPTTPDAHETPRIQHPDTIRAAQIQGAEDVGPDGAPYAMPTRMEREASTSPATSPSPDEPFLANTSSPAASPTLRRKTTPPSSPAPALKKETRAWEKASNAPAVATPERHASAPASPPPQHSARALSTSPAASPPPALSVGSRPDARPAKMPPQQGFETSEASTSPDSFTVRPTGAPPSSSPVSSPTVRIPPSTTPADSPPPPDPVANKGTPHEAHTEAPVPSSSSGLALLRRSSRTTPGRDSSFASSFASWATPRTDTSMVHLPQERHSPTSLGNWPGMYEFSYLTDKEELDEEEAGGLVPYAVEELSSKLFSIETLGNVDARELLEMVAQLDRTHTERTIFLQHRLARSHRLNQVLRADLEQAHGQIHSFEQHVHDLFERRTETSTASRTELQRLAEELEGRLRMLPSRTTLALDPAPEEPAQEPAQAAAAELQELKETRAQLNEERTKLREERAQLDMARRDLEIRLAGTPLSEHVSHEELEQRIAHAVATTRESCMRDADVRVAQAQRDAHTGPEMAALRAENATLRAQLQHAEERAGTQAADEKPRIEAADASRTEALAAHVAELERMLDEAEVEASAAQESFRDKELEMLELKTQMEEQVAELEQQVRNSASAVLNLATAKQESEAELTAMINKQQKRIQELEHDVAHRGLELIKLEKQKESISKEALHVSLALSAKDQELQMLKRGTQNAPPYWKLLAQRKTPERPALQPKSTNEPRRVSSEAAKRLLRDPEPRVELASTPNPVRRGHEKRFPVAPTTQLPELSTSTIDSVELSYRP